MNREPLNLNVMIRQGITWYTLERKRAAPKRFRPAAPKPTATCLPLPEAPPKPRMMYQTVNQLQFVRIPHGLVQAKCQATYLKTGTNYSHQTILAMTLKIRL